jgi:PKD repeat protein
MDTDAAGPPAPGTPTAAFSASIESGTVPLDVDFMDLSSQLPTGWSWDFGDTGSSGSQHPSHQYSVAGTYTVSLSASNANGSHTRVLPNLIMVPEPGATLQLVCGIAGLAALHNARRRRSE